MRARLIAVIVGFGVWLASARADASFHLTKIVEVFPGTAATPAAQYVVLQAFSSGQNFVGGQTLTIFDASNNLIGTFALTQVSGGANQAKILIATTEAATLFGVTADATMTALLPVAGGKVCFASTIDCVSWGAYAPVIATDPLPFGGPLRANRAIARRLDISGGPTVLDSGDDTSNCATDFVLATPAPKNNAGTAGTPPASTCGDHTLAGLEDCDDGNPDSNDGCSATCVTEVCGDHTINNGNETCDDGNLVDGDGCDHNCKPTGCGNGVATVGETCDDGNLVDGDGCDHTCKPTGCGNGVMTAGETCDDGNLTDNDGCDHNCKPTGCGNGVVTAGEACDPPNGTTCSATCQKVCSGDGDCTDADPCTANERCVSTACVVDPVATDDSEPCTIDGCDTSGVFHTAATDGSLCTLAAMPASRALCLAGVCGVSRCGDGFTDTGEACDDGNAVDDDACTDACTLPRCGDGIAQAGEQCDDGNATANDGCTVGCMLESCGDGIVQASEGCDDGNTAPEDGCSALCKPERCGDGVLQVTEDCDDGNTDDTDTCTHLCTAPRCGDGLLHPDTEACDDGNTDDGDGCDRTCHVEGDGGCDAGGQPPALLALLVGAVLLLRRRKPEARGPRPEAPGSA